MSAENLLVTIVIPVYNSSQFLASLYSSLSSQTFKDFKILFVYDKSEDSTLNNLNSLFFCEDSKFASEIIESPQKKGVGHARDLAIESGLITTKYVIFMDSDDRFGPDYLESLVDSAQRNHSDIAMCGFNRVNLSDNRILSTEMVSNPDVMTNLSDSSTIPFLNPAPWNKLFLYSVIEDSRFVCRGGGEDEMFFLKVLPNCKKISFINKPLYTYLIHDDSVLSNTDILLFEVSKNGYKDVVLFYKNHGGPFDDFEELMEASIFVRFGIGMTTRTCLSNQKEKKRIINESKTFFNENLTTWKRNHFLSFTSLLHFGIKGFSIWMCRFLYKTNAFSLFIFAYSKFIHLFKKEVRW